MEEKIWQLFLAVFTAVTTVAVEKIAEEIKKVPPRQRVRTLSQGVPVPAGAPISSRLPQKEQIMNNIILILVTVAVTHIAYRWLHGKEH